MTIGVRHGVVELANEDLLWRRIHPHHVRHDMTVKSVAFNHSEMSVDVAKLQHDMSITLAKGAGIAEFEVSVARNLNQEVRHDPGEDNHAHALVIGDKPRQTREALRDAARFTPRQQILASGATP